MYKQKHIKMKKIYTLAVLTMLTIANLQAQITEGKWLAIGSIGGGTSTREISPAEENKNSFFGVQLQLGKAIKNNVVVGGLVGFNTQVSRSLFNNNETNSNNLTSSSIGLFTRHYKSLGKGFNVFAQSTMVVGSARDKSKSTGGGEFINSRSTAFSIGLAPGISYQIAKKLQVEIVATNLLSLQYSNQKEYSISRPTRTTSSFSGSSSLNNGLNVGALSIGFALVL